MCENSVLNVTYVKEKIIKVYNKKVAILTFNLLLIWGQKFFSQWLYFYNQIRLLNENKFISKRAWEISQKLKWNFVSVATLALLAILSMLQADKISFFANGYSFAVLAIK